MKSASTEQSAIPLNQLGNEILAHLFTFFDPHEQVCLLAHVCRSFRQIIHSTLLPKLVEAQESLEAHQNPVFVTYPNNRFRLFHACRNDMADMTERLQEPWALAAYAGNLDAVRKLLGESFLEHRDELGASVVLFLAMGGHTSILKELVVSYGTDILNYADNFNINPIIYACTGGLHLDCMAWLIENSTFTFYDKDKFGSNCFNCIPVEYVSDQFLIKLAFLLNGNFKDHHKTADLDEASIQQIIHATKDAINEVQTVEQTDSLSKLKDLLQKFLNHENTAPQTKNV